jgi:hypothetical protein
MYRISEYNPAESRAVAGIVKSQAIAISPATSHLTLFSRSAAPTPMMVVLTTWVVDTGPPTSEADKITAADVTCEEKPSTGRIL